LASTKYFDSLTNDLYKQIKPNYKIFYQTAAYKKSKGVNKKLDLKKEGVLAGLKEDQKDMVIENASQNARTVKDNIENRSVETQDLFKVITRYIIEYNRKFTLSVSCLVLFFIGAPLGAIIRKGGLGLPVVVSVIFFLIYHIISTIGEKMARDGTISPLMGMWIAIFVLTPLGLFLTYKATADSALFDIDYYKNLFKKLFKRKEKQ
uniref:LptF/LptG family permease n=1 Tax=Pseudopedobacter sp. TaxID=1936787 RepID=UPI0033426846